VSAKILLTVAEVADALSLGRSKVYELMAAGQIEAIKIGRSRRVPADSLAAFIERARSTSRSDIST
jgi:excisionase family DNA binding protein